VQLVLQRSPLVPAENGPFGGDAFHLDIEKRLAFETQMLTRCDNVRRRWRVRVECIFEVARREHRFTSEPLKVGRLPLVDGFELLELFIGEFQRSGDPPVAPPTRRWQHVGPRFHRDGPAHLRARPIALIGLVGIGGRAGQQESEKDDGASFHGRTSGLNLVFAALAHALRVPPPWFTAAERQHERQEHFSDSGEHRRRPDCVEEGVRVGGLS
jgi:hypothetical protein